jgi:hypothetical protein
MQHLHYNNIIGPKIILLLTIASTLSLYSIVIVSQTQDQLFAKKGSHSHSSSSITSSLSTVNSSADESGNKKATTYSSRSLGSIDPIQCDQPGYPSCYSAGYSNGQANPRAGCPNVIVAHIVKDTKSNL